jgi:PAS domain S-box-containing protein
MVQVMSQTRISIGQSTSRAWRPPWAVHLIVLALAVFVSAYACIELPSHVGPVTPIWLANSIVLATLLSSREKRWPLIAGVGALADLMANFATGYNPVLAFGLAASNSVEFTIAALALSRLRRRPFEHWRPRDCLYFGFIAVTSSLVAAGVASLVLASEGRMMVVRAFGLWALADMLGLIMLTPCLLVLAHGRQAIRSLGKPAIWPFLALIAGGLLSFGQNAYPIQFLPAFALLVVAWRLRTVGAALGLLVMGAIAIPLTLMNLGPFAYVGNRLQSSILALQLYLAVCFFIALPVSAQAARVRKLHADLRQALGDSREDARKVRMAGEVARLGYWRYETASGRLTWSPQMYKMFGLDPSTPLNPDDAIALVHADDRETSRSNFTRAIAEGRGYTQDLVRIVRPDGVVCHATGRTVVEQGPDGAVTAVFGVLYDKTEAAHAEAGRKQAESRYRLLAENARDLIMQTGLDRRFTYVSPSVEAITGYVQDEVVGQSPLVFLHPEDAALVSEAFDRQVDSGGALEPEAIEYRIVSKDGREIWLESRPTALVDPVTRQTLGVSDVARDITARRALEADLRRAREEAEAAAHVKSDFLANMSHELRTPLTSVVGFTRLAAEQPELSALSRDYIERVSDASRALLCTVNDILDFSKLEAGQVTIAREPTSPVKVARSALELFLPQAAAKDLELLLDSDLDEGQHLDLDPDRVRQVLLNLIGNAVKFTDKGSVTLKIAFAKGRLTATVSDTGAGIPPDRMSLLFQRFSQIDGSLNRAHGGTGLGLAICKGLVEAMGGQIGVHSRVGKGSAFKFWVPARAVAAPVKSADPRGYDPSSAPGLRVLVVDDHPANRELATLFLAGIGAEVFEAGDGPEAIEMAGRWPFDVILMDLRMPKMDGPSVLAAIRAEPGPNDNIPILAFTADADAATAERVGAQGFQGMVSKPVEPASLIQAVLAAVAVEVEEDEARRVG